MKSKEKPLISVTAKECRWDYFKGSGAGGQKKNKTSSAVRCTHKDSGAVGQSSEGRSQWQNKKSAFRKMAESKKFQTWIKIEKSRMLGIESEAKRQTEIDMASRNLKLEIKDEKGKWMEVEDIPKEESNRK